MTIAMSMPINDDGATLAWARRLVVITHIPAFVAPVVYTWIYSPAVERLGHGLLVLVLGTVIGLLQIRHSIAASQGRVPAYWPWTFCALIILAYVPLSWYGLAWGFAQTTVIASGLMLLRLRFGIALATIVLLIATAACVDRYVTLDLIDGRLNLGRDVYQVLSAVVFDLFIGVALYGAVRLVRVLNELQAARSELADLAVGRERLRVSRDLHDLLGQSLSAVSLKGDLAIRLLEQDPSAARAEIQSLTTVARDALHGVRAITRDEHAASLTEEIQGAAALLRAAGIAATVELSLPARPAADPRWARIDTAFAWTVREGVTNILRHSQATQCEIVGGITADVVWLELANDGAGPPGPNGNGLAGLSHRASALGGTFTVEQTADQFRIRLSVPVEARAEVTT